MEPVKHFLTEVTEELLYNIVYDADEIEYHDLSDTFEEKTGHRPMDFFGFGNNTGSGWLDFIKGIPGLEGKKILSICDDNDCYSSDEDSDDSDDEPNHVYKTFNNTYLNTAEPIATYREMLLLKCCEIMKEDFTDLSNCKDGNGNTPLHLIAGLPGINFECSTLVKYLLDADVDPLQENDDGQTFLHIIFGRYKASNDDDFGLCFNNERMATTKWFVEDRVDLLDILLEELSQAEITSLVKAQDTKGNTVMHECAFSSPVHEAYFDDSEIYEKLLSCGANLRVQNNTGELPLHYAFNPKAFRIFLENGTVCRAKNYRDETPVLFILKYLAGLAFAETSASTELANQGFVTIISGISFLNGTALNLLKNITQILEDVDVRETAWVPDIEGNVAVTIILIAIRLGSYSNFSVFNARKSSLSTKPLRSSLVKLLRKLVPSASPNDTRRQNKKGQSFLHVLLDTGDNNNHRITQQDELLQSVELLLKHNADVNAVDLQGRTPLDIAYKHFEKGSSFHGKCSALLTNSGALRKRDLENNIASSAATSGRFQVSSLDQGMSNLRVQNGTRKLRSCPKRHVDSAQRLTDPNNQVAVVGKYRYSSQHPIGSGAFSVIFVGIKDENVASRSGVIDCRAYALKRLDKAKKNAEEIKREISTLLFISGKCENVIKCHESVEDQFFQYLCLDLMDGDLHEFIENESVNSALKADSAVPAQVANEIIKGLAYLHQHKFIHRDLKPGNILYTADPTLHFKIADFGLTKNTSTLCTMTSTRGSGVAMAPGTRCWMAPELVSMESREHTKESDIFSLGLVLHYLLTLGKHPFARANEEAPYVIERRIAEMQIHIDKALHPEASSFLAIILTKLPSKRPPASYLNQHPFLWSEIKKIEFLKAVGDQEEAANPGKSPNSALEQRLQKTRTGQNATIVSWDILIQKLFKEMIKAWKQKKYRTDKVIDLIRFIRNAYAHKQERSPEKQKDLEKNIFLQVFPSLVLDVFGVVQQLGFDESRSNIRQALSL